MTILAIDPDATCSSATHHLHKCLVAEGSRLAKANQPRQALDTLFRAYALRPGATSVLNDIAEIYTALEEPESATACRRGVIPESAEKRYFNSKSSTKRVIASRRSGKNHYRRTHRPESVPLKLPKSNSNPRLHPEFRAEKTESRGSFVSMLDNGGFWFDGFNTVIVDGDQQILQEHIKGNAHVVCDVARHRPEQFIAGTVCFLDARSSSIYYHWLIDVLPKLALLEEAGISLKSIDTFVVRCNSNFQKQTLSHLGVPLERIVAPWNDGLNRCSTLIVPFLKHDRGDRFYNGLGLGMAQWVPTWLKSAFVQSTSTHISKVYVTRASRGTRLPVDEDKLIEALQVRGFSCVSLETLTVIEQANLMATASTVIAPHGAGLSNITFCNPGTRIVEIFGDYVVPCYWALSTLSELDYHAYFVEKKMPDGNAKTTTTKGVQTLAERRSQNIELDVDDFLAYIDQLETPTPTGAVMRGRHPLMKALDNLKGVPKGDSQGLATAFNICRSASNDIHYAHVLYHEMGEIAIHHKQWSIAEEFAVKTLKKLPSSGAALKLLGTALRGQDRLTEAAICHRYGLPPSISKKHFDGDELRTVNSDDSEQLSQLEAYPQHEMALQSPISLHEDPPWELSQTALHSAAANTFQLNNATFWYDGFNLTIWDSNNNVISDISRGFPEIVQSALGEKRPKTLAGKTCILGNRNSSNYYHWMNDILPRLHVLKRSGINPHNIDQFIVSPLRHAFQYETLETLGIDLSKLYVIESEHYFQCEELLVPTYGSNTLGKGQARWNPEFLNAAFLPANATQFLNTPKDRLYISRHQSNGRSAQNEEELALFLTKRGFRRQYLEDLTVAEQARLFAGASVILGAHGAGLSNIVFCQADATVIELYEQHIAPCFWLISEMTGLRHAIHYCGTEPRQGFTPGDERYYESADQRRNSNLYVDLPSLETLLEKLQIT